MYFFFLYIILLLNSIDMQPPTNHRQHSWKCAKAIPNQSTYYLFVTDAVPPILLHMATLTSKKRNKILTME